MTRRELTPKEREKRKQENLEFDLEMMRDDLTPEQREHYIRDHFGKDPQGNEKFGELLKRVVLSKK